MKKPDLLILIAIWQLLIAFGVIIGIAAIGLFAFPAVIDYGNFTWGPMYWHSGMMGGVFGLSIAIIFLICLFALALAGGIGLLQRRALEWARVLSIVNCALSLFWVPVGTIIGTLSIIYLTKAEVRDYFNPPQA